MVRSTLELHHQDLLQGVPVPDQEMLLSHKRLSSLLHPQQVGESLTEDEKHNVILTLDELQQILKT